MLWRRTDEDRDPREPGRLRRLGNWYMQSTATLIGSATLVCVVLAGAIYLVVVPAPSPAPDPETSSSTVGPADALGTPALVAPEPVFSLCAVQPAADVPPEALVLATYDTRWDQVGGALLPRSDTAGPRGVEAPRSCFARTPEGALYSLVSFFGESLAAPDAQSRIQLVQARASRGGAYQQLLDQLTKDPTIATSRNAPAMRLTGYRWVGYTPDFAQVDLQYQRLNGVGADEPVRITAQTVWEANDWLIVVPNANFTLHQSSSATITYTPWGPPV